MNQALESLEKCTSPNEARGYEGSVAAAYFRVLDILLRNREFSFVQRVKSPPTDPVNSMLSFGYTLLFNNIYSMVMARGLNPYVGFLHAQRLNHPSLVSDLLEEFRVVIDSLVVHLINTKRVKQSDFLYNKVEGLRCTLNDNARKLFISEFEKRMHQQVTHPTTGFQVTYRRAIELQVREMAQVILGEKSVYVPFQLPT